jgi:outer membrane protein assembly factor BamB
VINPTPVWTADVGSAVGAPVPIGPAEHCTGFLVARGDGSVVRVGLDGRIAATMRMDLPTDTGALIADLQGDGTQDVVSSDCQGSVYAFSPDGKRLWKYTQTTKSRDFRQLVVARLDSGLKLYVLLSDSRGTVTCLDASGKLKLSIKAARYRVSAPAIDDEWLGYARMVFGTDAGDVDCVDSYGQLCWSTHIGAACGRSLPVFFRGERPMVLLSRSFVDAHPAVCALDALTGQQLWTAPCTSQSYQSIACAPMTPGAPPSILFGDKNSLLYCVDAGGHLQWKTQLEARGIYFAPAIAQLSDLGPATIFVTVRTESAAYPALYTVDGSGKILDALPLPGGGGSPPILCRFAGERALRLAIVSGSKLSVYSLNQSGNPRLLSAEALRQFQPGNTVRLKHPTGPWPVDDPGLSLSPTHPLASAAAEPPDKARVAALRSQGPDGAIHVRIAHNQPTIGLQAMDYNVRRHADAGELWMDLRVINRTEAPWLVETVHGLMPGRQVVANTRLRDMRRKMALALKADGRVAPLLRTVEAHVTLAGDLTSPNPSSLDGFDTVCATAGALLDVLKSRQTNTPLLVRRLQNPWESQTPDELLTSAIPAPITVTMPGNAYQSEAISVTNLTGRTLQMQAEIVAPADIPRSALTLHDCVQITPGATGIPTEDPLPVIAPGTPITLEPGLPRKLWLTFCSKGLSPGKHTITLRLGDPASSVAPVETPITLEVLPIALPERSPFRHVNWLYLASIADPVLREKTLQDALAHGTNVFNVPQCTVQVNASGRIIGSETTQHDELVRRLKGHAEMLIDGSVGLSWPPGSSPAPDVVDRAYTAALRWYDGHMRDLGCDYADYALYLSDEPGLTGDNSGFKRYVEAVRRVKAADPKIRIFCNPAGGATEEMLAPIAPLIDIWCPDMHLVKMRPASLQRLFADHGEYWHYEAPGDQRSIDPLGFYRMQPWVAFRYGMSGAGYWVYSQTQGWFEDPARNVEYGAVYPTPEGPVDSKRWEATREGIQDYELLSMLRDEAREHGGPEGQHALALIDSAVADITRGQEHVTDISRQASPLKPDYVAWMRWRSEIIDALIALKQ